MLKPSAKRPVTPSSTGTVEVLKPTPQIGHQQHWRDKTYDCVVSLSANGILNLTVDGGSDNGDFAYFGDLIQERITYLKGLVREGDLILEIQGQKVAGYTQRDIVAWLNHCCRNGTPVTIKAVRAGYLTRDLRQYLNTRFQKGSLDHDLQNTIRDNLYLRTVPCTTRPPRDGEINGVDYTFLTPEEFVALEKSGNLLESGIYEGNHYGTPKPPKETPLHSLQRGGSLSNDSGLILPGAHPSSEGKRRRNRSNVEAMASKTMDPEDSMYPLLAEVSGNSRSSTPQSLNARQRRQSGSTVGVEMSADDSMDLGPLPDNWEKAYTDTGEPYFIDHNSGNSQWLDPRLARVQKKTIEDCDEDELPYGWERIDDPHYGTYYIDHVNRKTQYENPVLQARRRTQSSTGELSNGSNFWYPRQNEPSSTPNGENGLSLPYNGHHPSEPGTPQSPSNPVFFSNEEQNWMPPPNDKSNIPNHHHQRPPPQTRHHPNGNAKTSNHNNGSSNSSQVTSGMVPSTNTSGATASGNSSRHRLYRFTNNPEELQGEMVATALVKSARGFGFTIVGGDDGGAEEFLQIKSVVANGPAWNDGKLKTGDVLVYVNKTCVLGFSHQDMVLLFQSIPPEETVLLEVCRGYPLPFDPEDPNNEIVTTMAVKADEMRGEDGNPIYVATSGARVQNNNPTNGDPDAMSRSAKSMPDLSVRQTADGSRPQRHNSADLLSASGGDNTPDILDFNPHSSSKPEFLTVEIVKGTAGFGFTIADSAYGQKVKKILDRPRCKLLQEGDVLVRINQLDVRGVAHADVVQVLKDCPCGDGAQITVQRGGLLSPSKNRGKFGKNKSYDGSRQSNSSLSQSFNFPENSYNSGYLPPLRGAYRSKTPTAELYSTREKEPVVIRPKTPLVDTRNWSLSSSSEMTLRMNKPKASQTSGGHIMLQSQDNHGINPNPMMGHKQADGMYGSPQGSSSYKEELINNPSENMQMYNYKTLTSRNSDENHPWLSDLGRTKEFPWLSRSFRDTSQTMQRERHPAFNPRNSDSKLRELYKDNNFRASGSGVNGMGHMLGPKMHLDLNGFYPTEDSVLQSHPYLPEDWRHPVSSQYSYRGHQQSWLPPEHNGSQLDGGLYEPRNNSTLNKPFPAPNGPFYSYLNSGNHGEPQYLSNYEGGPMTGYGVSSHGSSAPHSSSTAHFQPPESSSGYYTSAAISPHPSNTSQSLSGSQYDSLTRRKHSTSFEHEQPITSLMGQFPKEMPQFNTNYGMAGHQRLLSTAHPSAGANAVDMTVTLHRQESGFGFRIVGGTEEGSQVRTVSIGHIVPGGAADLDSRLHSGDEILSVDGQSVLNTSHHHVVQLMGCAAQTGKVTLGIRRKLANFDPLFPSKSPDGIFPYDITVTRKENEGFGFVIISSVSRVGSTIGRIIDDSPAERCSQLHVGDRILAVNGVNILNMHHGEIVNLIKDSGFSVVLTIGAPQDSSSSASISQKGDDQSLEHDDHYYAVEIHRGLRGFGFSIRGGREFHNMPLFVLRIAEHGPAHQDNRLQVGDQIIEINGINTKDVAHTEAIEIIKQGGNSVRLLVKRGGKIPLSIVDHPSPITPTGSLGTPLSAGSSILNGPICQSSPRDAPNYEMPRDLWNYETR